MKDQWVLKGQMMLGQKILQFSSTKLKRNNREGFVFEGTVSLFSESQWKCRGALFSEKAFWNYLVHFTSLETSFESYRVSFICFVEEGRGGLKRTVKTKTTFLVDDNRTEG